MDEMTPEQKELSDKLTNLQLQTVLGLVEGKSYADAYFAAGGKAKTPEAARTVVSRMLTDVNVKEFYDSMVGEVAQEAKITLHTLLEELEEARVAAMSQEKPQAAAMVAATMGKAKLLGLEAPHKVAQTDTQGNDVPLMPTRIELVAPKCEC